jgi:hypothetical protein
LETTLAVGDTISFVLGKHNNLNGDETALRGTIVSSPEMPPRIEAYRQAVAATAGLISYYPFDFGNPADAYGTNDGTLVQPGSFTPGLDAGANLAVLLQGGQVNLGEVGAFDFTNNVGTVELLVRPEWDSSIAYNPTMVADRNGTLVNYSIHLRSTKDVIDLWNGAAVSSIPIPPAGTAWHHLAVVFNGANWSAYWDGQLAGTQPFVRGIHPEAPTQLGSSSPSGKEQWLGALDEVAFYSSALSAQTIHAHYETLVQPPTLTWQLSGNALIFYWVGDFKLQEKASLNDPTGWSDISGGGTSPVSVVIGGGNRCFRLMNK